MDDNGYCQCECHGNPSPYTLASLRFFRDARGKTHYY
jgi:hypothetical protein